MRDCCQVHPEAGHLSCPGLTCTPGSYLALPAVDLEALQAEFQDDGPAPGTVLGEELWGEQVLPLRPCPAQPGLSPSHQGWVTNSPICQGTEPGQWTLRGQGRVGDPGGTTPHSQDHLPHLPPVASALGTL